ncbi:hypothetical protein B0A48_06745 [Cryoendolithus antarcticus]|uniref:Uncharacterized protein n=1 Tax=Cryoendolithus antarcticus TaxID=1507870 RepID=A0A1V8T975_9PEZI|nr:hypothetical protein B0A48_06745 [Cryoendolithus antarcticus]
MWLRAQSRPNETWIVEQDPDGVLDYRLHNLICPDSTTGPTIPAGTQLVKPAQLNPLLHIPCSRAIVTTLHSWRHKRESRRNAVGTPARPVTDVNTLTLGMLMDGVFNTKIWISLHLRAEAQTRTYGTLANVLADMRAKYPGTFIFDLTGSKIFLAGVLAPTHEFWQVVWDEALEAEAAQAEADASTD